MLRRWSFWVRLQREKILDPHGTITFCWTAARGDLDFMKYMHESGCRWDDRTSSAAASSGHLACLAFAHERGCPWDEFTCFYAAEKGRLECLAYAHERGCPWNEATCSAAARNDHLECLAYAHEHGCPWNMWTCFDAAEGGHLDCLAYCLRRGAPSPNLHVDYIAVVVKRSHAIRTIVRAWRARLRKRAIAAQVKISRAWMAYSYAPESGRPGYTRTMRSLKVGTMS